tara:strand:+ start:15 stop:512 length:498 start_codon:yes stop_codon:yes gene_type:complete
MKTCTKCKQEKPYTEFYKRSDLKKSKDGYEQRCISCIRESAAISYIKNKDKHLERRRKKYTTDPSFHMFHEAKKRAKRQGVPFTIEKSDIKIPDKCPVLGIPLYVGKKGTSAHSPSLDKYVPELGYVKGNIHVISLKANTMKSNATSADVQKLLKWMLLIEKENT